MPPPPPVQCASTPSGEHIAIVRDPLPFPVARSRGRGLPVFAKKHVITSNRLDGFVTDGGYACACPAAVSCGYRGKVLSALQFEKHEEAESKNQSGHIFLSNGTSLHALFQALGGRGGVPAEAFADKLEAAAGVDGVTVEPPSALSPSRDDVEMLTEEEKASLCLLGLSCSTTQSVPMYGVEGPAAEQIEEAAGRDDALHDVEIRNGADEQRPRCGSLSTITPIKVRVAETKYQLDSYLKDVRGLLSTGLLEGFKVTYKKDEVEKIGRISGQGYSCGCPECNYSTNVRNACEFEQHSGQSSNNQNDHIFLETGVSLFKVVKALKHYKLYMLGDFIQPAIGMPPNMAEYKKWKASFQKRKDYSDAVDSDDCSTQR
nr:unnamed protein product [Digitaria exilis]